MVRDRSAAPAVARLVALLTWGSVVVVAIGATRAVPAAYPPPARLGGNIMIIIADDMGPEKVGAYGEGDDKSRPLTPNIDRLAAEGVRFVNAYAMPVCSPTRATILTGRYPIRNGVGTILRGDSYNLSFDEVSMPEVLIESGAGYDTSMAGKWHLTIAAEGGNGGALRHGFHWAAGSTGNLLSHYAWWKFINGVREKNQVYSTVDTTNDAIERANVMSEPWLLWVSYNAPHDPYEAPPAELHSRRELNNEVDLYAAMAEALDTEVGRLLRSIDPAVLANTTIIFLGDNGTPKVAIPPAHQPQHSKGTVDEAGIRVPLIVSGAAVPAASRGRASAALVGSADIFSTVAELAGVNLRDLLPEDYIVDGISFVPLLVNPSSKAPPRHFAYSEIFKPNAPGQPQETWDRAIRDARWKLVRRQNAWGAMRPDRFYDLSLAPKGRDGQDLCPCPSRLTGEALAAYERLLAEMTEISGP